MRLDGGTAFDSSPDGLDLDVWNSCRLTSGRDEGMYTWCRHDVQAALRTSFKKYIARKERQREKLGPVLPAVRNRVEREQGLESLACENPSHRLFMLMTRVNRVPVELRVEMTPVRVR